MVKGDVATQPIATLAQDIERGAVATPLAMALGTPGSCDAYFDSFVDQLKFGRCAAEADGLKGLAEAISGASRGVADTGILTTTTNHSDDGLAPRTADDVRASAPKKGLFRLMPASSVAEVAWQAYQNPKRLHWYVPKGIRMIDLFKGLSPEFVRRSIVKSLRV